MVGGSSTGLRREDKAPLKLEFYSLCGLSLLQPRIHGLAFEGQDSEDAFVDSVEGLVFAEALQGLDAERKFAQGQ
jgi:hypothetical protein